MATVEAGALLIVVAVEGDQFVLRAANSSLVLRVRIWAWAQASATHIGYVPVPPPLPPLPTEDFIVSVNSVDVNIADE